MATRLGDSPGGLVRLLKRFGAKAAIIVVGAAIAVGTLQQTSFLPKPAIVQHPFSDALSGRVAAADSSTKPWNVLGVNVEHDRIAYWMTKLTTTMRTGVETTLGKKTQYDDMIRAKLEERHMPADLIYLAMIESEFNPNATSPVKAKGLWQFMAATARQFGLIVRGKTDERTDPAKATDAALTYLNALHSQFGSWYLAAAAYNSGAGTVSKALREVTGKTTGTDSDFFRILPRLPKETQDYVPKLIATARLGNNPVKYGLTVKESGGELSPLAQPAVPLGSSSATAAPIAPGSVTQAPFASTMPSSRKSAQSSGKSETTSTRTTRKATTAKNGVRKKPGATKKATLKKSAGRKASSARK